MYIAIVNAMYHTAAVVLMQSAEFAAIEVLDFLHNFFAGVHHERAVCGNRFVNRHATQEQQFDRFFFGGEVDAVAAVCEGGEFAWPQQVAVVDAGGATQGDEQQVVVFRHRQGHRATGEQVDFPHVEFGVGMRRGLR